MARLFFLLRPTHLPPARRLLFHDPRAAMGASGGARTGTRGPGSPLRQLAVLFAAKPDASLRSEVFGDAAGFAGGQGVVRA